MRWYNYSTLSIELFNILHSRNLNNQMHSIFNRVSMAIEKSGYNGFLIDWMFNNRAYLITQDDVDLILSSDIKISTYLKKFLLDLKDAHTQPKYKLTIK